ncbi:MAG: helix-turn-helix transcriptional regulator [Nitrospirae bacterium]|nr:MAG: helix-turn-helix transcriptional regulator [Nitrospirota bacterium]
MERGPRGSGIPVDPDRVREARIDAGLSLAQLAGDDVSRTFIHFVERGRSRPSRSVLKLIARRTGKPMSYFILKPPHDHQPSTDLASELIQVADHVRQFGAVNHLNKVEREAMKLVELTLRQAVELTKSVRTNSNGRSKRS